MKCLRLILAVLAIVPFHSPGRGIAQEVAVWHRDFPAAVNEAKAKGKKLLIVFTGTDWIEICQKFHDEILAQPAFIDAVSGRFTLLKLEFPKDNMMPREEAAQKNFLREAYRVRGYPTVILAEADGRPFGINGYQPILPEEYATQIRKIDAAHEAGLAAMQEAGTLEGLEKAKCLRRAIPDLPGTLTVRYYRGEMEEILANDPENALEVRDSFSKLLSEADYGRKMQELGKESKWAEMVTATEAFIEENKLEGEALQRALFNQAALHRRMEERDREKAVLQKIVTIDPESEAAQAATEQLEKGAVAEPSEN